MGTLRQEAPQTGADPRRVARLRVVARPHWVDGWLLRSAARPHLRLDGTEHALAWGRPRSFPVAPGTHELTTFWRYRGTRAALGAGTVRVPVGAGEEVLVLARNGPLNHQPLQPRRL